jgi:hypothetical protein
MAVLAMVALLNMIQRWYVLIIKKEGLAPRSPNGKIDYPNVAGETCEGDEIHL